MGQKAGAIPHFRAESSAADIEIELSSLVRLIEAEISASDRISRRSAVHLHDLRIRAESMIAGSAPQLVSGNLS